MSIVSEDMQSSSFSSLDSFRRAQGSCVSHRLQHEETEQIVETERYGATNTTRESVKAKKGGMGGRGGVVFTGKRVEIGQGGQGTGSKGQ